MSPGHHPDHSPKGASLSSDGPVGMWQVRSVSLGSSKVERHLEVNLQKPQTPCQRRKWRWQFSGLTSECYRCPLRMAMPCGGVRRGLPWQQPGATLPLWILLGWGGVGGGDMSCRGHKPSLWTRCHTRLPVLRSDSSNENVLGQRSPDVVHLERTPQDPHQIRN